MLLLAAFMRGHRASHDRQMQWNCFKSASNLEWQNFALQDAACMNEPWIAFVTSSALFQNTKARDKQWKLRWHLMQGQSWRKTDKDSLRVFLRSRPITISMRRVSMKPSRHHCASTPDVHASSAPPLISSRWSLHCSAQYFEQSPGPLLHSWGCPV